MGAGPSILENQVDCASPIPRYSSHQHSVFKPSVSHGFLAAANTKFHVVLHSALQQPVADALLVPIVGFPSNAGEVSAELLCLGCEPVGCCVYQRVQASHR